MTKVRQVVVVPPMARQPLVHSLPPSTRALQQGPTCSYLSQFEKVNGNLPNTNFKTSAVHPRIAILLTLTTNGAEQGNKTLIANRLGCLWINEMQIGFATYNAACRPWDKCQRESPEFASNTPCSVNASP